MNTLAIAVITGALCGLMGYGLGLATRREEAHREHDAAFRAGWRYRSRLDGTAGYDLPEPGPTDAVELEHPGAWGT